MLPQKPRVFISSVTSELSQAREEDSGALTFLTPADTARYRYFRLYPDRSRESNYNAGVASGRMASGKTDEFLAAFGEACFKKNKAYPKDLLGLFGNSHFEIQGRLKVRIDSRSFIPGGPDPAWDGLKFVCDVLAWDFTQVDAQGNKNQPKNSPGAAGLLCR